MSRKLGVLVAIPIKGRKLVNRSGGKQSPYIQLKLGDAKKRTKASLIASVEPEWDQEVRFDVFQNHLDLHVMVIDEGKKNEIIGDGILMLHEVIDKGELDVWFPIKYKGSPAGDIYFELTFYAAAPPVVAGGSPMPPQVQMHTPIRHTQPGFHVQGTPLPHPPFGPPSPFPGNTYQQPRPYSGPQQQPYPIPQPSVATGPFRPPGSAGPRPAGGPGPNFPGFMPNAPPFRPSTLYTSPQMPHAGAPNSYSSPRPIPGPGPGPGSRPGYQMPQPFQPIGNSYPPGNMPPFPSQPLPMNMPVSHPHGVIPPNSYPNSANMPNYRPNNNPPRPPASGPAPPVTPLMQYNYSLGNFP